jgi:hypothetical protein
VWLIMCRRNSRAERVPAAKMIRSTRAMMAPIAAAKPNIPERLRGWSGEVMELPLSRAANVRYGSKADINT